jgi:hypothetical protein
LNDAAVRYAKLIIIHKMIKQNTQIKNNKIIGARINNKTQNDTQKHKQYKNKYNTYLVDIMIVMNETIV